MSQKYMRNMSQLIEWIAFKSRLTFTAIVIQMFKHDNKFGIKFTACWHIWNDFNIVTNETKLKKIYSLISAWWFLITVANIEWAMHSIYASPESLWNLNVYIIGTMIRTLLWLPKSYFSCYKTQMHTTDKTSIHWTKPTFHRTGNNVTQMKLKILIIRENA